MYTRLLIWLFCLTGLTISLSYHLISKYNFLEAECKNQSFLDSSGPNVSTQIGSLSYSGPCFNSNGASNIMSSRFSVPTMWSNQIKSAMSISFWIQVNKTALTQPLILLEFSSSIQNSYPSLRIGLGRSTLSSTSLQLFISISNVGLTQQTFLFSYPKPQVYTSSLYFEAVHMYLMVCDILFYYFEL